MPKLHKKAKNNIIRAEQDNWLEFIGLKEHFSLSIHNHNQLLSSKKENYHKILIFSIQTNIKQT